MHCETKKIALIILCIELLLAYDSPSHPCGRTNSIYVELQHNSAFHLCFFLYASLIVIFTVLKCEWAVL